MGAQPSGFQCGRSVRDQTNLLFLKSAATGGRL